MNPSPSTFVIAALLSGPAFAAVEATVEPESAGPWALLQEATDPEIVALRDLLLELFRSRAAAAGAPSPRVAVVDPGQVRRLEDRIRSLEQELRRLRSQVEQLRYR